MGDSPTASPTPSPTDSPTASPTDSPTASPTDSPTASPTSSPTKSPTSSPTKKPTRKPTKFPTRSPTKEPTAEPTRFPTRKPTNFPTRKPTVPPTFKPCQKYNAKKGCNAQKKRCLWSRGKCNDFATNAPTTASPTTTAEFCSQFNGKKVQCNKKDQCTFKKKVLGFRPLKKGTHSMT